MRLKTMTVHAHHDQSVGGYLVALINQDPNFGPDGFGDSLAISGARQLAHEIRMNPTAVILALEAAANEAESKTKRIGS